MLIQGIDSSAGKHFDTWCLYFWDTLLCKKGHFYINLIINGINSYLSDELCVKYFDEQSQKIICLINSYYQSEFNYVLKHNKCFNFKINLSINHPLNRKLFIYGSKNTNINQSEILKLVQNYKECNKFKNIN